MLLEKRGADKCYQGEPDLEQCPSVGVQPWNAWAMILAPVVDLITGVERLR